jgi:hypothetical protein
MAYKPIDWWHICYDICTQTIYFLFYFYFTSSASALLAAIAASTTSL